MAKGVKTYYNLCIKTYMLGMCGVGVGDESDIWDDSFPQVLARYNVICL